MGVSMRSERRTSLAVSTRVKMLGWGVGVALLTLGLCSATTGTARAVAETDEKPAASHQSDQPKQSDQLSESQKSSIVRNCAAIKQSLEQLQRVDSKTRTYLGTTYETIANKFITPLNIRLVKNNLPTLSTIQTDFMAGQTNFRNDYTTYMRELEGLIATDCQNNPGGFYTQLITVREKRAQLRSAALELMKLTTDQYKAVEKLKKEL